MSSACLRLNLAVAGACMSIVVSSTATAPGSQRGHPKAAFRTADFSKLKWLEGTWQGSSPGESTFYERYQFLNDSTIDMA